MENFQNAQRVHVVACNSSRRPQSCVRLFWPRSLFPQLLEFLNCAFGGNAMPKITDDHESGCRQARLQNNPHDFAALPKSAIPQALCYRFRRDQGWTRITLRNISHCFVKSTDFAASQSERVASNLQGRRQLSFSYSPTDTLDLARSYPRQRQR